MARETTTPVLDQGMGLMGAIVVESSQLRTIAQYQSAGGREFQANKRSCFRNLLNMPHQLPGARKAALALQSVARIAPGVCVGN